MNFSATASVNIDIKDPGLIQMLLGRPEYCEVEAERESIRGRAVLITGAGGSIGGELAIAVARSHPKSLVIVDSAETNLFRIESELSSLLLDVVIRPIVADISRESDVRRIFREHSIDLVYHAAAYKHVHFAERYCIPVLRTNVLGTEYMAHQAAEAGATFILISTDKAEQPTGLLGMSKRLAELITNAHASGGARSFAIRSGNVLGSNGSFLEVCAQSLRNGHQIPVTDMNACRYYLTARELATLLLRANCVGHSGDIYWLNLGPELSVRELLERLNEWLSRTAHTKAGAKIIGLRPGERLREPIVLTCSEPIASGIWLVRHEPAIPCEMSSLIRDLDEACKSQNEDHALRVATDYLGTWNRGVAFSHSPALRRASSANAIPSGGEGRT
jgi:FlaA1/EpsC-like NDP-sugar epimerase